MTTDHTAALVDYLDARDRQRSEAVDRALATLTPFERRLIREAAVMAYVRGAQAGRADLTLRRQTVIPPDSAIVAEIINCCHSMSDLYPLLAAAADEQQHHLIAEVRTSLSTEESA